MEVLIGMIGTQQRPGNTTEIRLSIPAVQGKMIQIMSLETPIGENSDENYKTTLQQQN